MNSRAKNFTLALGLLTVIASMTIAYSGRQSSETTRTIGYRASGAFTHYVVENGTQWVIQTTYKFFQNKLTR